MRTLKLTIAYEGTAYAGWQCQPDRMTVQETLETALKKITGESIRTLASGRTDAGVHALGQVVGFRTQSHLAPEIFVKALNANLPEDIAVLAAEEVSNDFHAIRDVVRKRYRYVIDDGPARDIFRRRYVWHYPYGRLDAAAMQHAARALLGKHDFRSFESSGAERATSVRTVFDLNVARQDDCWNIWKKGNEEGERGRGGEGECSRIQNLENGCQQNLPVSPSPSLPVFLPIFNQSLIIEIEADGFLYNMVRSIVGTLVQVGRGAKSEQWPGEVLAAQDRRRAGATAPPQGLFLVKVDYE
jgi:tRNA pseudouridine38-40 synthase